jgi:hypothetical protein
MRQNASSLRPRYAALALIAFSVLYSALHASRRWNRPIGLAVVGRPAVFAGGFTFALTNTTDRQIFYRVTRPQFRCYGAWSEFVPPAEWWVGSDQPPLAIPAQTLPAGGVGTAVGAVPKHITAPLGATAWRVGVVWGYSSQTRWQQLRAKMDAFITGRSSGFERLLFTNFSTEVTL